VKPARTLIVNADDFGLTGGVSRGILETHRAGIVTSTTVLVNREIGPGLVDELLASRLGVGLHLNLTLGAPVSDPRRVPSLVDAQGLFVRDPREVASRARHDEARIELGTQIDAFRRLMGRFPTHLDTHHHVGALQPLLDVVLEFAAAIRVPVRSQNDLVRTAARRRQLRTPDHFIGDVGPEPYWTAERVLEQFASLPAGVTEAMTHPGHYDEALAYSRYGKQRDVEVVGLTDPRSRAMIEREGIRLAHFGNF
jgi:predicted glycoside hydrolase/deacetylase ChbG (UPF0249 family)